MRRLLKCMLQAYCATPGIQVELRGQTLVLNYNWAVGPVCPAEKLNKAQEERSRLQREAAGQVP